MSSTAVVPAIAAQTRHVLRAQQFSTAFCQQLFERAMQLRPFLEDPEARESVIYHDLRGQFAGRIMVWLSAGESTRTRMSFAIAARRLGVGVESTIQFEQFSSYGKGESRKHIYQQAGIYNPDLIVIRDDKQAGAAELIAQMHPSIPVINAGDGSEQHPTQGLLDICTLLWKWGSISGQTAVVIGDLRYGRAAKMFIYMLSKYPGIRFVLVSPPELQIPEGLREHLNQDHVKALDVSYEETGDLSSALRVADVAYVTRIQQNLFPRDEVTGELTPEAQLLYARTADLYSIGLPEMELLPPHAILMHPLPVNREHPELQAEVTNPLCPHPQCIVWDEVGMGLWTRAALIEWCLHGEWWERNWQETA